MASWKEEFPLGFAVPEEITSIPGLVDASWGNDVCPKFHYWDDGRKFGFELWCDHPKPGKREFPNALRFAVLPLVADDDDGGYRTENNPDAAPLFACEDLQAILVMVKEMMSEK